MLVISFIRFFHDIFLLSPSPSADRPRLRIVVVCWTVGLLRTANAINKNKNEIIDTTSARFLTWFALSPFFPASIGHHRPIGRSHTLSHITGTYFDFMSAARPPERINHRFIENLKFQWKNERFEIVVRCSRWKGKKTKQKHIVKWNVMHMLTSLGGEPALQPLCHRKSEH